MTTDLGGVSLTELQPEGGGVERDEARPIVTNFGARTTESYGGAILVDMAVWVGRVRGDFIRKSLGIPKFTSD